MDHDRPDRAPPKKGDASRLPMAEPEFPELTAIRALDREQHIERSLAAGLTREQAEKHADEHAAEWSPRHIEERER